MSCFAINSARPTHTPPPSSAKQVAAPVASDSVVRRTLFSAGGMARPDAFGDLLGGFDVGMANASQQMAPPEQADNVTQDLDKFGTFRCCQMAPHNV